jgi:hypothetical protein
VYHRNLKTWCGISLFGIAQYTLLIIGKHKDLSFIGLMDSNGNFTEKILIPSWLCILCIDIFYVSVSIRTNPSTDISYSGNGTDSRNYSENFR